MVDLKTEVIQKQLEASNPNYNVWVNASAGSGKTKVLVDRILRLLLNGVTPSSVLCITFTKAGAIEMRSRLQLHLEKWVFLTDAELVQALSALNPGVDVTKSLLVRARTLLNVVLETPLKIETIHSFAQTLVFNNMAQTHIALGARLMDELQTQDLLQKAIYTVLTNTKIADYAEINEIYAIFSKHKFHEIIYKIAEEKAFFKFLWSKGEPDFVEKVCGYLDSPREIDTIIATAKRYIALLDLNDLILSDACSDSDKQLLSALAQAKKAESLEKVMNLLLTSSGTLRKQILSKKLLESNPDKTLAFLNLVYKKLAELHEEWKAAHLKKSTILVFKLSKHLLDAYDSLKQNEGLLDYDDLIFNAINLLANPETAQTALYQLEMKLEHILIDEAQDTNLYQWKLIDLILEGFFDQVSNKTLFVVGDHKQSIFSFQGTDPDIFYTMKQYYQSKVSDKEWRDVALNTSFRSFDAILRFVDGVFCDEAHINFYSNHSAFFGDGGRVVQHPLVTANDDVVSEYEPFADLVVNQVKDCINRGYAYDDVLMLIRKRGAHLDYVQDALTAAGMPFSSPNKKPLMDDNLVEFVVLMLVLQAQPSDRSSAIKLLLNPLLNVQTEAIELAFKMAENPEMPWSMFDVKQELQSLFNTISQQSKIEDKVLNILTWADVNLNITANQWENGCLIMEYFKRYSQDSSSVFYSELAAHAESLPLTQQAYQQEKAVKILTVHGAKGLQSKVVMLLDTTQPPISRAIFIKDKNADLFLCAAKSEFQTERYKDLKLDLKDGELKEYYRLLYVALTRAAEELHIFGVSTKSKISENAWYALCEKAGCASI